MGLVIQLPFDNGIRTVEIDESKNIDFLDYDIELDQLRAELGERATDELVFYNTYQKRGFNSLVSEESYFGGFATAFVDAIFEQGAAAYDPELTNEDIAKMFYEYTIGYRENLNCSEWIIKLASEEKLVEWLLKDIEHEISSTSYHIIDLASILGPHINASDDVEVKSDIWYDPNTEMWENTIVGDFEVIILGKSIAKWREYLTYSIFDPVSFHGSVEDWEDSDMTRIKDNTIELLRELEIEEEEIPKLKDPDPPDHPESDPDGEFAVLYEFDKRFDVEWILMQYKTLYDAREAEELSGYIFRRDGDEEHVTMTIMRKLTPEELRERDFKSRQIGFFKEPEEEEEEWRKEWAPLEEES